MNEPEGVTAIADAPAAESPERVTSRTEHLSPTAQRVQAEYQATEGGDSPTLQQLRLVRHAPRSQSGGDDDLTLDDAIVELLKHGDRSAAAALITSASSEELRLERALARSGSTDTSDDAVRFMSVVDEIVAQKREALAHALHAKLPEMDEETHEELFAALVDYVDDPERALAWPTDMLANLARIPRDELHLLRTQSISIEQALPFIPALQAYHLMDYAAPLLGHLTSFSDPVLGQEYLASFTQAINTYWEGTLPYDQVRYLARFQNPMAALALAKRVNPTNVDGYLDEIIATLDLSSDFGPPFELTPHTAGTVARTLQCLTNCGVPFLQRGEPARLILTLEDSEHPGRHQLFVERLQKLQGLGHFEANLDPPVSVLDEIKAWLGDESQVNTPLGQLKMERFLYKVQMAEEVFAAALATGLQQRRQANGIDFDLTDQQEEPETLEHLPGMQEFLWRLQIPEHMHQKLFDAWNSLSVTSCALLFARKTEIKDLSDSEIATGARIKVALMYEQATALQAYVEKYKIEELIKLHETFHIVNFARATPEEFYDMMQRWEGKQATGEHWQKGGEQRQIFHRGVNEPPRKIAVAATASHNPALRHEATRFFARFGSQGAFYFEAATAKAASRCFVQVGTRDRKALRDPSRDPTVKYVALIGHGTDSSIQLSDGEWVDTLAYVNALMGRDRLDPQGTGKVRANDYSQHLGNIFRFMAFACSTAKTPENLVGKDKYAFLRNIVQFINTDHGVQASGPLETVGDYTINALTGEPLYYFNNQLVPSITYYPGATHGFVSDIV